MLRASVEATQGEVDLRAITEGAPGIGSEVAHAAALSAFAEAAVRGDASALASARAALRSEAGSAALVDAAAVIGNFERMTRIADATGIPLDVAAQLASQDFRDALGLERFPSARNTPLAPRWQRALGQLLAPAAKRVLARFIRR